MENGEILASIGADQSIQDITFSPDGHQVVSCLFSGGLHSWNFELILGSQEAAGVQNEKRGQMCTLSADGTRILGLTQVLCTVLLMEMKFSRSTHRKASRALR